MIQRKSKHHMNDHKSTEIRAPNMKSSMNIEKGTQQRYTCCVLLTDNSQTEITDSMKGSIGSILPYLKEVKETRQGIGLYKKNMTEAKGGFPILFQSVHTNFTILSNIWMKDSCHKIPCSNNTDTCIINQF